jgi:meso-butanediol dehydrogenase/(S,S)-butanediol dehydrogenase/diacetyl reductase
VNTQFDDSERMGVIVTGRFDGRVAVVTGAGSGIGKATAERLASEGAHVVLLDSRVDRLEEMSADGRFTALAVDVAKEDEVAATATHVREMFGSVDILVANAGVWDGAPFLDITTEAWDRLMAINLRGTFLVCRDFGRLMVADAEVPRRGRSIVVTASTNSFLAEPESAHYNASKGAIAMLIKSMAVDLAPLGIRVNGIAPGTIRTNIHPSLQLLRDEPSSEWAFPPLRRWGMPDDCASAICYLASKDASYITGEILVVDGGQSVLNGVVGE